MFIVSTVLWIDKRRVEDKTHKTKDEESTRLVYTGFHGELEHLKIKTRLIDEKFSTVMDECVIVTL
jgi:hypothetical protein